MLLAIVTGDLALDSGVPISAFNLYSSHSSRIDLTSLRVGDIWPRADGAGTLRFTDLNRWASFQIAYDPGKGLVLADRLLANRLGTAANPRTEENRV